MSPTIERRAALILALLAVSEGAWVVANFAAHPEGFARYLGLAPGHIAPLIGWLAGLLVTTVFVAACMRLPSVRSNLVRISWLKLLALLLAVAAGILEETVFRKMLMDYLSRHGIANAGQVLLSGVAFGLAHAIWGVVGRSWRAAAGAAAATGLLGIMLGFVYLAAGRNLGPCVAAHFLIDFLAEPGLVLGAARGEIGK